MSVNRRQVLVATTSSKSAPEPVALALAADHRPLEASRDTGRRASSSVEPVRRHGSRLALERQLERLGRDGVADEPERVVAEQDLARARGLLEPGGDVDRVTGDERVALAGDDRPGVHADPRVEPELVHDVAQLDRRARRPQCVVLARDGDPEHGHHRVADELLDGAAVPLEHDACRRRSTGSSTPAAPPDRSARRSPSTRSGRRTAP